MVNCAFLLLLATPRVAIVGSQVPASRTAPHSHGAVRSGRQLGRRWRASTASRQFHLGQPLTVTVRCELCQMWLDVRSGRSVGWCGNCARQARCGCSSRPRRSFAYHSAGGKPRTCPRSVPLWSLIGGGSSAGASSPQLLSGLTPSPSTRAGLIRVSTVRVHRVRAIAHACCLCSCPGEAALLL